MLVLYGEIEIESIINSEGDCKLKRLMRTQPNESVIVNVYDPAANESIFAVVSPVLHT